MDEEVLLAMKDALPEGYLPVIIAARRFGAYRAKIDRWCRAGRVKFDIVHPEGHTRVKIVCVADIETIMKGDDAKRQSDGPKKSHHKKNNNKETTK